LNIVDPLAARRVDVGNPATPGKMLIKVDLFAGPGGAPIAGVDPNQFAITVNGVAVTPADRISAAYIQGQYWLLVRAPVQTSSGAKPLTVTYAGLSDTELFSVQYGPPVRAATMVVVDRSGSMNDFAKLQAAKDAARLYIDSWSAGDLIGVASFSTDATVNLNLGAYETERANALNAINGLVGDGETSIGDGAQAGMQNLIDRDGSTRVWSIMLLSDGIENQSLLVQDFINNYNARRNANPALKVPQVIAVALGPDADRIRMEKLAADTGGVYFVAALPAVIASTVPANTLSAPDAVAAARLSNDLAEIYRAGSEYFAGQQQIGVQTWAWNNDDYPLDFKFRVDGSASEAIFVIKWDTGFLLRDTYLRKPDGTTISPAPVAEDSLHRVYRVAAPEPGEWAIVIDEEVNAMGSEALPDGLPTPIEV
ncbi:MAG: vWA domain-containing protein, partial [Caldilineaceae bacterium]